MKDKKTNLLSGHSLLPFRFVKNKTVCIWSQGRTVCFLWTCNTLHWYDSLFGVRSQSLKILLSQHALSQAVFNFPVNWSSGNNIATNTPQGLDGYDSHMLNLFACDTCTLCLLHWSSSNSCLWESTDEGIA